MALVTGWATNKGIIREKNQDNCYLDGIEDSFKTVAIAVMCDGMGGLSDGEVASRLVCDAFKEWFEGTFKKSKKAIVYSEKDIQKQMSNVLNSANQKLIEYGTKKRVRIGTTASVLLVQNDQCFVAHIGDSRVYHLSSVLKQVTEDDTVAAQKVRRGEITQLEYEKSKERHILTQCVGVNGALNIHFYTGTVAKGDVFFLCCDGMYHYLSYDELKAVLMTQRREKGTAISTAIERLIDRIISRGEKDNITGAIICCI